MALDDNFLDDIAVPKAETVRSLKSRGRRQTLKPWSDLPESMLESENTESKTQKQQKTTGDNNRRQIEKKPETNQRQQPKTTKDNQRQNTDKPETIAKKPETTTEDNQRQKSNTDTQREGFGSSVLDETGDNRRQTQNVSGSNPNRLPLDQDLSPVLSPVKGTLEPRESHLSSVVSSKKEECLLLQPETVTRDNRRQKPLPTSRQQLNILRFLADQQIKIGLDHTPRYKACSIAEFLTIKPKSIKKQVARLVVDGFLQRLDARDGRGDAGTVYRVPATVVSDLQNLNRRQKPETTGDKNRRQQPETNVGSSSLNLITTTNIHNRLNQNNPTPEELIAGELQTLIQRFGLDDLGLGSNDLLDVWRAGIFSDLSTLKTSLEHLAFYLDSADSEGIQRPKAWLVKQLRRGFYPPPAGFRSFEEIQEEKKLAAAKERRERIRKIRRERFEVEFEIWVAELSTEKKKEILGGTPAKSDSNMAKALFRDEFSKQFGDVF